MQVEFHPQLYKDLSTFVPQAGISVEEMLKEAAIRYLEDLEDHAAIREYMASKARGEEEGSISLKDFAREQGIDLNEPCDDLAN